MTPMDLAYFAFAVHLVHCLRMVFLNLDEKGERCRDCIETLLWLEALLLRFGGHRRKCPMTNIVSDKVRLSSTSRGTKEPFIYYVSIILVILDPTPHGSYKWIIMHEKCGRPDNNGFQLQGVRGQSGFFNWALTERNIQVRLYLKVVFKS